MKKHINKQATREWNIVHNKKTGKTYYYHRGERVGEAFYLKTRLRQEVIITKGGQIKKDIKKRMLEGVAPEDRAAVEAELYERQTLGKRYTVGQITAIAAGNKISINLANLGLTPEWAAEQTDSTVDEILDYKNWHPNKNGFPTDIYTNPRTGKSYKAVFSYEGESYFIEIAPEPEGGEQSEQG